MSLMAGDPPHMMPRVPCHGPCFCSGACMGMNPFENKPFSIHVDNIFDKDTPMPKEVAESIARALTELRRGETHDISTLWDDFEPLPFDD